MDADEFTDQARAARREGIADGLGALKRAGLSARDDLGIDPSGNPQPSRSRHPIARDVAETVLVVGGVMVLVLALLAVVILGVAGLIALAHLVGAPR